MRTAPVPGSQDKTITSIHNPAVKAVVRLRGGRGGGEAVGVTGAVYEKIALGERGEGLLAVARQPKRGLAELEPGPTPLLGGVESVEKPGNLGALLRTAD